MPPGQHPSLGDQGEKTAEDDLVGTVRDYQKNQDGTVEEKISKKAFKALKIICTV